MRPLKVQFYRCNAELSMAHIALVLEESTSTLLVKARTTDRNKKEPSELGLPVTYQQASWPCIQWFSGFNSDKFFIIKAFPRPP